MPPKRRKISDLCVADTNELLLRLNEFRSGLDEGDEDLPTGLIDKLEELSDKLQDAKVTEGRMTLPELYSAHWPFLAHFLLQGGSNDPPFIENTLWATFSDH